MKTILVLVLILLCGCGPEATPTENPPETKSYSLDVAVADSGDRRIDIEVTSDFPDGTNLLVQVKRVYFEENNPDEEYAGEIYSSDHALQAGTIRLTVEVADQIWLKERQGKKQQFQELGIWTEIENVKDEVEVWVLYSPAREQPAHVREVLGEKGEMIANPNRGSSVDVTKTIDIPFKST